MLSAVYCRKPVRFYLGVKTQGRMTMRRLFCDINPLCYQLSVKKEILKRHAKNFWSKEKIAKEHRDALLPNIVKSHSSILIRKLNGVDLRLQENKVTNILLACSKIDKIVIKPNETFSFWVTLGPTTRRRGYQEGLVIGRNGLRAGYGGGLCQMANMIPLAGFK